MLVVCVSGKTIGKGGGLLRFRRRRSQVTGRFTEFDIVIMIPFLDWGLFSPSKGEGWGCMSVWKITGIGNVMLVNCLVILFMGTMRIGEMWGRELRL